MLAGSSCCTLCSTCTGFRAISKTGKFCANCSHNVSKHSADAVLKPVEHCSHNKNNMVMNSESKKSLDSSFDHENYEVADVNSVLVDLNETSDDLEPIMGKKLQGSFDDAAKADSCFNVYLRVRPSSAANDSTIKVHSNTEITTLAPENSNRAKYTRTEERQYAFTHVFGPESDQGSVYETAAVPMLRRFECGDSCVLFAYGITNAGKTHTIQGSVNEPGILPRIVTELLSKDRNTEEIDLQLSMLEIYQEQIFDLLSKKREKLSIRDGLGKVDIPKLSYHKISQTEDAFKLMEQGASKRCQTKTALNNDSSRSHAMYSITLTSKSHGKETQSVFHIVDLAGAERMNRTKATGFQMKEANNINMSLMQLWRCLNAMKKKSNEAVDIIPFRESKLTHLLMPLLSRASSGGVTMIACVNPQPDDYDETITVLGNASIASKIREIANLGRVAGNTANAASTLYQPTVSSMNGEQPKKELGLGQKFLRKKTVAAGVVDNATSQSLISKVANQVGWGKKAATVNLTAVLAANKGSRNSSIEQAGESSQRSSTEDMMSIDESSDLLQQMNDLKKQNADLMSMQALRETEIRAEVALEMAQSTQQLLCQIEELQQQLYHNSDGDIMRSVKKARKRMIDISKDNTVKDLAAAEEELENMRIKYEAEITELKSKIKGHEGTIKELQLQLKQQQVNSTGERSPLMMLKDTNTVRTSPSPAVSNSSSKALVGSKRKSVELSVDIMTDNNPFKKNIPPPVNNENRGPPSIFPTADMSPKFNSSAFRMLRSQVGQKV